MTDNPTLPLVERLRETRKRKSYVATNRTAPIIENEYDALINPDGPEAADALEAAQRRVSELETWQPIETALKDGTAVLVRMRADIYPGLHPERSDLERWNGLAAVMRNRGDSSEWCFAAPVGHGGFPDSWITGWQPLAALAKDETARA